jgi:hypothetical protein
MHLSSEEALDIVEGRASEDKLRFWNDHFGICPGCQKQLTYWEEMHSLLRRENLEDAPEPSIRMAKAIFQAPAIEDRSGIQKIIATLVFNSFAQPAMAGARGGNTPQQFLLSAMEFDIHIRIWESDKGRRLTGQILSRDDSASLQGAKLHLLQDGKRFSSTEADPLGEFEFEAVPTGPLYLQIDLPRMSIYGALNAE